MKYFENVKTAEELKKKFFELAKKLHPDCGGNAAEFVAMRAEYERVFSQIGNVHATKSGGTYTKESAETSNIYPDIISKIITFEDVTIEIIGSWIWVSGATINYKEALKSLHFVWSRNKKAWYYNGGSNSGRKYRGHYSMDGLRNLWGSETVDTKKTEKIA